MDCQHRCRGLIFAYEWRRASLVSGKRANVGYKPIWRRMNMRSLGETIQPMTNKPIASNGSPQITLHMPSKINIPQFTLKKFDRATGIVEERPIVEQIVRTGQN